MTAPAAADLLERAAARPSAEHYEAARRPASHPFLARRGIVTAFERAARPAMRQTAPLWAELAEEVAAAPPSNAPEPAALGHPHAPDLRAELIAFLEDERATVASRRTIYEKLAQAADAPSATTVFEQMSADAALRQDELDAALARLGEPPDPRDANAPRSLYLPPKLIYYYLYAETKLRYAHFITLFRHVQRHPGRRFDPIFQQLERWCDIEFRNGEAFALALRGDPRLTRGLNKLWIRLTLTTVFAARFLRERARPNFYAALGLDPRECCYQAFRICATILRRGFPLEIQTDDPAYRAKLERLRAVFEAQLRPEADDGALATLRQGWLWFCFAWRFAALCLHRPWRTSPPEEIRSRPVW